MNAFEVNKILGAILGALVFIMGLSVLSDIIFSEEAPEEPGYRIAIVEEHGGEEEAPVPFAVLLASADAKAGQATARICSSCHAFEAGPSTPTGPNLHGVAGRGIASLDDFNYSAAMVDHAAEAGSWSYDELNGFLENPQRWVPGTIMGFAGVKDPQERANLIAFLASVTPDAPAFPDPPVQAAPEGTGADGEAGEGAPAEKAAAPQDPEVAFAALVADSDPAAGERAGAICKSCHTVEEGAAPLIGPTLYGVFGAPVGHVEDYDYSSAFQKFAEEAGTWTLANLDRYLKAPMKVVPGTKMAFAGLPDDETRAKVIAWLHALSPEAPPLTAERAQEAEGTADAIIEEATVGGAAGRDEPDPADPAVQDVKAAAQDEIAEDAAASDAARGTSAEDSIATPVAPQTIADPDAAEVDRGLASDEPADAQSLVGAGEAAEDATPDPVQTGAGTEASPAGVEPAPAEAATDAASGAQVPEPTRPTQGASDDTVDADVEAPVSGEAKPADPQEEGAQPINVPSTPEAEGSGDAATAPDAPEPDAADRTQSAAPSDERASHIVIEKAPSGRVDIVSPSREAAQ